MGNKIPQPVYLKDYLPPAWLIDTVDLHVTIGDFYTEVSAKLGCRRNPQGPRAPLRLNGEEMMPQAVRLDGQQLPGERVILEGDVLTVTGDLPESFQLETVVRIDPDNNTQLSGLYRSKDGYFTQCEAEGFRRITYFPDRPDIMSRYSCTILADYDEFPQLLCNGNLVATGGGGRGRHWARWEDPSAKPCYLFALVAAKLDVVEDRFVTASGREVRLGVYVEPGKRNQCGRTMAALKAAMHWDEQRFGLEMDLDQYMIVAVSDFNMGAMENKGLNIFNTKYVLADAATATDSDFQNIDRVVAHEYFHNWTGNRVTCRDWFQLSLKEGLTVFRDQEFGADMHGCAVTRIQDVRSLRQAQFPEDAGPMAHPVRPASYAEINNFYTATVYQKGAEVVRMIQTLIGREAFRRGMDLYFQRHDGQAVTCEEFVAAMQDASGTDLTQFRLWYARAGTPRIKASGSWDSTTGRYTLTLSQNLAAGAYEERLRQAGLPVAEGSLHIPVALGLVLPDGTDAPLRLTGEASAQGTTRVLSLTEPRQCFVFEDIAAAPVASLLRNFSAPVMLELAQSETELAHLMAHDSDPFNRWEAGQRLATRVMLAGIAGGGQGSGWITHAYVDACRRILKDGLDGDAALAAEALMLPGEKEMAEVVAAQGQAIDPEAIFATRSALRSFLASELRDELESAWENLARTTAYAPDGVQVGQRALRNLCLGYLAQSDNAYLRSAVLPRLLDQFEQGDNMTDVMAALSTLANLDLAERETALASFYARWQGEALVVDKWLQVQATSSLPGTTASVRKLMRHPAFELRNPNKVYALLRSFCAANPRHFHAADGSGYALGADAILALQEMNPLVASRIARCFDRWRQFDTGHQVYARAALERIAAASGLAAEVAEVVGNALR